MTRYESTPGWKNTFNVVVPSEDSALFLGEKKRFESGDRARTAYQREERQKKSDYEASRQRMIKTHTAWFKEKTEAEEMEKVSKEDQKLSKKGARQFIYEHIKN